MFEALWDSVRCVIGALDSALAAGGTFTRLPSRREGFSAARCVAWALIVWSVLPRFRASAPTFVSRHKGKLALPVAAILAVDTARSLRFGFAVAAAFFAGWLIDAARSRVTGACRS